LWWVAADVSKPPLPLPVGISMIQTFVVHATHLWLHALLVVQPIVGWMAPSAYGVPIRMFRWFELPPICRKTTCFPSSCSRFTA
jgi:cytochrome b561